MSIKLEGFDELKRKLNGLPERVTTQAMAILYDSALELEQRAKRAAPKDQGYLAGRISSSLGENSAEIASPVDYSPFVEWGTKSKVNVPAELSGYASQFRGGKGGNAKEFIYAWCKRKGIDPKHWFLVYRSIMANGIRPQPYFFIQMDVVKPKMLKRLDEIKID